MGYKAAAFPLDKHDHRRRRHEVHQARAVNVVP